MEVHGTQKRVHTVYIVPDLLFVATAVLIVDQS